LRFLYDKRSVVSGTEQCAQTKNNYCESDRHNASLNEPQQHSSAGIKYSEFLAKLCALGNKWNFLIAGSIPGAAVSPTRHLLADAISSGKAERKDDQIGNYVWQRRTFYIRLQQAYDMREPQWLFNHCGPLMLMSGPLTDGEGGQASGHRGQCYYRKI
jgi:hypothetical protein